MAALNPMQVMTLRTCWPPQILTSRATAQVADDLNPVRVMALFKAIAPADLELLDMPGRPEDLVMTALPVPPLAIRPSVEMDIGGGSNEDDITMIVKARS